MGAYLIRTIAAYLAIQVRTTCVYSYRALVGSYTQTCGLPIPGIGQATGTWYEYQVGSYIMYGRLLPVCARCLFAEVHSLAMGFARWVARWVLLVGVVCFSAVHATRNVEVSFFQNEGSSAREPYTLVAQPDIASFGVVPYQKTLPKTGQALLAYVQWNSWPLMCSAANIGPPNHTGPWVALALRGNCPFAQKTLTAQQLGAEALIIVDTENARGGREPHMADGANTGDELNIPTLLISQEDGKWLGRIKPQYVSIDFSLSGPQVASPNVTVWNLPTSTKGAALLTHYRPWFTESANFKGRVNVQPRFPFLSATVLQCDGKAVTDAGCDSSPAPSPRLAQPWPKRLGTYQIPADSSRAGGSRTRASRKVGTTAALAPCF